MVLSIKCFRNVDPTAVITTVRIKRENETELTLKQTIKRPKTTFLKFLVFPVSMAKQLSKAWRYVKD